MHPPAVDLPGRSNPVRVEPLRIPQPTHRPAHDAPADPHEESRPIVAPKP